MNVKKVDHIGIAVESIEQWIEYYRDVLGLDYTGAEVVEEQKVRVAFLTIGESRIELLEPTSDDSPVAGFLVKRGGGIHHIALSVEDIDASLEAHRVAGARLIDDQARIGAHGMKIAFIHPKATGGVLVELCQKPP